MEVMPLGIGILATIAGAVTERFVKPDVTAAEREIAADQDASSRAPANEP